MAYGVYSIASVPYAVAPAGSAPSSTVTSERFLLLSPRESDAATFTASSEVSGLPATNLQDMQPAKKWRATAATPQTIDIDFGYPVAANALALVGHNLSDAGMLRVRGGRTLARSQSETAYDVTSGYQSAWPATGKPATPDWPHHTALVRWTNDQPFQYWRVDIADGGALLTYLEAGRLVLGREFQPSANFDLGGQPITYEAADVQIRTAYGRTFTDRRTISPARLFELSVYALTRREVWDGIAEIQRLRGTWGDVICALDPGEVTDRHRFVMQGVFANGGAYTLPTAYDSDGNMLGAGIRLRELI